MKTNLGDYLTAVKSESKTWDSVQDVQLNLSYPNSAKSVFITCVIVDVDQVLSRIKNKKIHIEN